MKSSLRLAKFLKPYQKWPIPAPLLMILEVAMDLMQPRLIQHIVDVGIAQLASSRGLIWAPRDRCPSNAIGQARGFLMKDNRKFIAIFEPMASFSGNGIGCYSVPWKLERGCLGYVVGEAIITQKVAGGRYGFDWGFEELSVPEPCQGEGVSQF